MAKDRQEGRGRYSATGVGVGLLLWRLAARHSFPGRPSAPSEAWARETFAGYRVRPSDFVLDGKGRPWRVNSDGSRHSLKRWSFDRDTGEFFKVTNSKGGMQVSERVPHNRRAAQYVTEGSLKHLTGIACASILDVIAYACLHLAWIGGGGGAMFFYVVGTVTALLGGAATITAASWFNPSRQKADFIGPEPLKAGAADFGPSVKAQAPIARTAPADDLAYRPTE